MTGPRKVFASRNAAMPDMYRRGQTLEQIGAIFGLTRERVRQILTKQFGVSRDDGGQAIKDFLSVRDKLERRSQETNLRNARDVCRWGMTTEELRAVSELPRSHPAHPLRKFTQQRTNAGRRGIEWQLTFKQWLNIWQESGHWGERGKGQGYCMARFGDTGPYSDGNVEIITIGQNFSDSYLKTPWHQRNLARLKPRGHISIGPLNLKGKFVGWQIRFKKKYITVIRVLP